MYVCAAHVCSTCMQCPQKPEEGIRMPEAGVTDSCEVPCSSGIPTECSEKATSALNHWAPAPSLSLLKITCFILVFVVLICCLFIVWWSEDSLWQLVLSSYHVSSRDLTQVVRLGSLHPRASHWPLFPLPWTHISQNH